MLSNLINTYQTSSQFPDSAPYWRVIIYIGTGEFSEGCCCFSITPHTRKNTKKLKFLYSSFLSNLKRTTIWKSCWNHDKGENVCRRGQCSCIIMSYIFSYLPVFCLPDCYDIPSIGVLLYSFVTYVLIIGSMELIFSFDLHLIFFSVDSCADSGFKRSNRVFKQLYLIIISRERSQIRRYIKSSFDSTDVTYWVVLFH